MVAAGAASPTAQGHEITSTVMEIRRENRNGLTSANVSEPATPNTSKPIKNQKKNARSDIRAYFYAVF